MLLMFLALVVVVCMLIRRDPRKQPSDPKRAARKQQGRMWMIAALALLAGLTLGRAPVVGPPVTGSVTAVAEVLTGTDPGALAAERPTPTSTPARDKAAAKR
jgi:hypothetical protein